MSMARIPKPDYPCPEGKHWELRTIPAPPYAVWTCITDFVAEPQPDPVPPSELEDPAQWPWPLDILQSFIIDAFSWIGDVVAWGVEGLQYHVDELFSDMGIDLTDIGDWLNTQIKSLITTSQGFLDERITATQVVTETAIKTTQGEIEKHIVNTQEYVEGIGTDITNLTETAIPAVQTAIGLQIARVQQRSDQTGEAVDDIRQIIQDEVGPAIMTFINATAGPFLKSLNNVLEEV